MSSNTKHNVPALRRAVMILDLLQESNERLNAADIVKRVKIPKSTGHGLIHVMVELDMLQRHVDGKFTLGPRLSKWGSGFLSNVDLIEAFHQISMEREDLLAYTLTLSIPEKNEVVYIACRNSTAPLGLTFRIGMRLPILFTATGKAIMATWSDAELDKFAKTYPWSKPLTSRSITTVSQLIEEAQKTRRHGFSIDDCQIRDGMICLGGAIKNHTGQAVAGIAISLLEKEATEDLKKIVGNKINQTALQLSKLLGYQS
ncbi:IclR family transcriptional regulator [uncultured Bartonella sp.]|uniref:IclR family transcriptional regulator n=1 Tax=uncultured Bartonella sp. TaxID=104108 RepID=UPI00261DB1F9|nr:IclR family transcriptional regulator [uncultured Bartonella sp.]